MLFIFIYMIFNLQADFFFPFAASMIHPSIFCLVLRKVGYRMVPWRETSNNVILSSSAQYDDDDMSHCVKMQT